MKILQISILPYDFAELIRASELEGFTFIKRLSTEWANSANRFDGAGEFLLASSSGDKTIGICGINIDPYLSDSTVARLRHLYVLPAFRSKRVGSDLVCECLGRSKLCFNSVRLRVPDIRTGVFYENLGFEAISDASATHSLGLS